VTRRRAFLLGLLVATACAHPGRRAETEGAQPPVEREEPPPPGPQQPGREEGIASYYARALEGRRTASGGRYDGRAMTCAHPSHAFGTVLRVTDVETGRSVDVKVTDRGPYTQGRIVDLSWAAARSLGILERGVARVVIEVIRPAQ
jgi:rare lipoprotein A